MAMNKSRSPNLGSTQGTASSPDPASTQSTASSPDPASTQSTANSPDPASTQSTASSPDPASTQSTASSPDPASTQSTANSPDLASTQGTASSPDPASTQSTASSPDPASTQSTASSPDPASTQGTASSLHPASIQGTASSLDSAYTPGTARGARLAALLVDEGTSLLRKIFEDEVQKVNPPSLQMQLEKHKTYLCKLRHLNPGQKKTLFPRDKSVPNDAQMFDISLLELLLKEPFCTNAPYAGPRNRLRQYRNSNYGHIHSTDLSEGDFERLWEELTDILVDLGGNRDKISDRLHASIDPEQEARYFNLLEQLYKEDNEVKDLLLDQSETLEELKQQLSQIEMNSKQCTASSAQTDETHSGLTEAAADVITCLKDLYATEYTHVRPLPWCEDLNLDLVQVYTNLQLQQRDNRGRFESTDTVISLADIYSTSEDEGSKESVGSSVRRIRVEGPPGIGKSCSCQKLAYDWSCGKVDKFKAVFFLEMRHLSGKVKDAIFEQLLPKDAKMTPDQFWYYIEENQNDILFILDGLDELSQTARESTDVVDLIQGKILRNCHVLVTSRPYQCVRDLDKCQQFYKIIGYSWNNSVEFIQRYFCKTPESASKLVHLLIGSRNLSEIVVNPLNNVLICVVWEDYYGELPSSKAELYKMIVESVARRYCTKEDLPMEGAQNPPNIEQAMRGLGKLSWEGLQQDQLQFNIDDITKKYGINANDMLNMGLLTRDYSFSRIKRTCYCAFLHKTFQEYMAAYYICNLVTEESSRDEVMKCLRTLFGITNASDTDKDPLLTSRYRLYREVQDCLLLMLGDDSGPLFDMFAKELNNVQHDGNHWNRLSFACIMCLGRSCAGSKMADIVGPYLSQHITNNFGDFSDKYDQYDDITNWFAGLTHVFSSQKKLPVSHPSRRIQHLTVNCSRISLTDSEREMLAILETTLSNYNTMHSVTLLEKGGFISIADIAWFSPVRSFIPQCGTESVYVSIPMENNVMPSYLPLLSTLQQLSGVPRLKHVKIIVGDITSDADFSEYDRLLTQLIARQSGLRSLRIEIGRWMRSDPETRGFGVITATLQSISEHSRLEVVELELPGKDALVITHHTQLQELLKHPETTPPRHETLSVELMTHKLTQCINKNKALKTLSLRWRFDGTTSVTGKIFHGICSSRSVSHLCFAIRRNKALETLVIDGLFSEFQLGCPLQNTIAKLMSNSNGNSRQIRITVDRMPVMYATLTTMH